MIIRREVVLSLAFIALVLFFVCLFRMRGHSVLADLSDNIEEQILNTTKALNLNDQIERDLHLCDHVHIDEDVTSKYHQLLHNYSRLLQDFIPQKFSSKFTNPCWYSHFSYTHDRCQKLPSRIELFQHSNESKHTNHLYCLPSFFLAGFPKCASTTLYTVISKHPDVAHPKCKEGQFWPKFIERDGNRETKIKQILWYFSHFTSPIEVIKSRPQTITLDASTHTLWEYISKERSDSEICLAPSLIMNVLPNAKFIVLMRDPTKRLFSHYWYLCHKTSAWRTKEDPKDYFSAIAQQMFHNITVHAINLFQSCIERGISRFQCVQKVTVVNHGNSCVPLHLGVGMYYYHLVPWLITFPREKFLFVKTEDLVSSSEVEMNKVWALLSLSNLSILKVPWLYQDKSVVDPKYKSKYAMLPETKQMLDKFYQPHNKLLVQLLNDSKYMWN